MSDSPPKPPKVGLGAAVTIALALLAVLGVTLMVAPDLLAHPAQTTVVRAKADLPALTVISTTHVTTAAVPASQAKGLVTDPAQAVGKVTTQAVAAGAGLKRAALLALPSDRWLVSVPISGTLAPAIGDVVALLGVRSGADQAGLAIADAVVVAAADQAVLVAVAPGEAEAAAAYLVSPNRLIAVRRFGPVPAP